MEIEESKVKAVYEQLIDNGICHYCAFRFLPNSQLKELENIANKSYEKSTKCGVCLGIFEEAFRNEIVEKMAEFISVADFDCDTYMIGITVPVSCQLRAFATLAFLRRQLPSLDCVEPTIAIRDAWRWLVAPRLSERTGKRMDAKAPLLVSVFLKYKGENSMNRSLQKSLSGKVSNNRVTKSGFTEITSNVEFTKLYPFPLPSPSSDVECISINLTRESIFLAGRYNKFSRELSQTPWIFKDGQRKTETSTEEIISNNIKKFLKADDSKFISSGREDVDVRMLGRGRPFAVEMVNPRFTKISETDIRNLEKEINAVGYKLIFVRDLQVVANKSDLKKLKEGEENKTKDYCAYCLLHDVVDFDKLQQQLPSEPIQLSQMTPMRVLHRRSLMTRMRTIHSMQLMPVKIVPPKGCTLFKINLNTQAGTYVKEFVEGDFGRTVPNLTQIFGDVPITILGLDVANINLDWPPPLKYDSENVL